MEFVVSIFFVKSKLFTGSNNKFRISFSRIFQPIKNQLNLNRLLWSSNQIIAWNESYFWWPIFPENFRFVSDKRFSKCLSYQWGGFHGPDFRIFHFLAGPQLKLEHFSENCPQSCYCVVSNDKTSVVEFLAKLNKITLCLL